MILNNRDRLRSLVAASGLSVSGLARRAQVQRPLLEAMLAGRTATCSLGPARRLEDYFGLTPGALFTPDADRDAALMRDLGRKADTD